MQSTGTSANPPSASFILRAHLEPMRPANIVTALAGGLMLHAGGVTMNDFFDRRLDAVERPERPIPGGRASAYSAGLLGATLLLAGVACAIPVSSVSGAAASATALPAVAYDAAFKHITLGGPMTMESCRGLVVACWYVAAIPLAHLAGINLPNAGEVPGGSVRSYISAGLLSAAAVGALLTGASPAGRIAAVCALPAQPGWQAAPAFYRACLLPDGSHTRSTARAGVILVVFPDGSAAAAWQGLSHPLGMVAPVVLASRPARLFPVE